MPATSSSAWVRVANIVLLILGGVALAWMLRTVGVDEIRDTLLSVRGWAVAILGVALLQIVLSAAAIHELMQPEQRMVSYRRVLAAQIAGQAVNSVTPTGTLGEVVKATMVMEHAPRYRAVSSVVAFNVIALMANAVFLLFALAMSLLFPGLGSPARIILWITFGVMLGLAAVAVVLARRGLARSVIDIARRMHFISAERREALAERLTEFDDQLRLFGPRRLANYNLGIALVCASRIVGWLDLWVIMAALGESRGFVFTVVAAGSGVIITSVSAVIPLGIGAYEGGQAGLFRLLGAGATLGLAIGLIRRVRTLVIAALGLLVMLVVEIIDHFAYAWARRRLIERTRDLDPD